MPEAPALKPPPNLNPSPKAQFRESGENISKHRALLESREFHRAIHYAKTQYWRQLAMATPDNNYAMAMGWKMIGVEEFLAVLMNLSESPPAPSAAVNNNLDHRA